MTLTEGPIIPISEEHLFSPPKQKRSREALDRTMAAARELIEEGGYDALNMDVVARRANVGVSAIYSRLGSKQGVFNAVQIETLALIQEARAQRFGEIESAHAGPVESAHLAVQAIAEILHAHERVLRAIAIRADVDNDVLQRGSAANFALAESFQAALLEHRDAIVQPDPDRAADVCFRIVYDTLIRRIVRGPLFESPHDISWDALIHEMQIICSTYLFHKGQP